MRVAFYSPLPPERSGIADYSYELLEELRHHVDVVAVVSELQVGKVRAPDGVPVVGVASAESLTVDCNLYQMGNNSRYHRFFFSRAFDEPGLLLMHDPSLADITAELCAGAESPIFRAEVTYDCPDIGPDDDLPLVDVGNGRKDLDRIRVLLARRIVSSNVRTLVHSSAMAREMRRRYPAADIQTIQLPAPLLAAPSLRHRDPGEVVFGVFGGINYYKRVRPLVDAFLEVRERHGRARMVIAGRADDRLLECELRQIAARPELAGALEIKTDLTLSELEAEMRACDVGITLRWPTAGEMSATLMRTFGAGRPAIVSDVLQFRELDERYCWRVTTNFDDEHDRLVEIMDRAAGDPEMCRRAGQAAHAFVARDATYEVVAAQYVEHLEHCAATRQAKRAARRPWSLAASRPLGVNVIAPTGTREVAEAARRVTAALRASGVDVVVVELPVATRDVEVRVGVSRSGALDEASDANLPDAGASPAAVVGSGMARLRQVQDDDDESVARAVAALDPADLALASLGPNLVDLYFVEIGDAERLGRLARVRRGRGRRVVPVVSPGIIPLTGGHRLLLEVATGVLAPSGHAAEIARMSTLEKVTIVPWPAGGRAPSTSKRGVAAARALVDEGRAEVVRGDPDVSADIRSDVCTFLAVVEAGVPVACADPWAAIAAFRAAFSHRERGTTVRLVVVLEDSARREEAQGALAVELDSVAGVLVVDPAPGELATLLSQCDVVVSLHRAEGFGLRLADAMALAKPVVATGYSGNLEYMDDDCACLVGYEICDQGAPELYLDPGWSEITDEGRFWASPDVPGAARWMRRLADDPALRQRIGDAAAKRIEEMLDPARIGAALRDVVAEVSGPVRQVEQKASTWSAI